MNDDAINDKATALVAPIAKHWPDLDLDQYVTRGFELDDERVVLQVDYGAAMFELVGDDLHAVGPVAVDLDGRDPEETIPDEHGRPFPLMALRGKVPCMVWRPDGSFYIAAFADDPFAAMADAAKRN